MNVVKLHEKRNHSRRDARDCHRLNAQARDLPFALLTVALMIAGVAVGARQELPATQSVVASPEVLAIQFDYFPSHYVNQGVEPTEEYPTF